MSLAIRGYEGDGSDLGNLVTHTWKTTFEGKTWFPIWDRDYFGWRMMDERILDRELMVCAYDGDKLVGCVLGEETDFSIDGVKVRGSLASYLSVDPQTRHRHVAMRLVDRLRQLHIERDLAICFGITGDNPGSVSKQFWDGIAKRYPGELTFLNRLTMWTMVLDPSAVARAGLTRFERLGSRFSALVPWGWTGRAGAPMRTLRQDDLDACRALVQAASARAAARMEWSKPRFAVQLDHPYARTLVSERKGKLDGFVNAYLIDWQGAEALRVGFVELCAGMGGPFDVSGLLVTAGRTLQSEGAKMVVMMDMGSAPRAALVAAGFLPMNPNVRALALFNLGGIDLVNVRSIHMAFT
jgi:hypothetical protein